MNRTQLSAFVAVASAGGFTRGAEALMVSQPAVSLQVAELEAALKTKLFDRLPRGVRLTAAGELLLGYGRRIESLEREAEVAVADLAGLSRGSVVIGASLTIGSYLLPPLLGVFRRRHPHIDITLEIANTQQIEQMVKDHRLDVAFTEGLVTDGEMNAQTVAEDRLLPIAPPGHPILKLKNVTARMLCEQGLILREAGSGTRAVIEDALKRRKILVAPLMSLGSTEAIKRAVQSGAGLSIVSELAIADELSAGTLAVVPIVDLAIRRPLQLLRPAGKSDSAAAGAFVALVRERTGSGGAAKTNRARQV